MQSDLTSFKQYPEKLREFLKSDSRFSFPIPGCTYCPLLAPLLLQAPSLEGRALSGKFTGVSKARFQILVPYPEKHRERTLHTPRTL
ncbi:hypothetical protein TNCV_214511 [Trichonephila clavipes]|nr:hypothetical protein TNCV_214511 [Trichonephila clavipes]